jgi:hypothetical protein
MQEGQERMLDLVEQKEETDLSAHVSVVRPFTMAARRWHLDDEVRYAPPPLPGAVQQ